MYDFYLGGKNNFAVDREAARRMIERIPQIPAAARGNRQFLQRAVSAAARAGIKQFIDIGSGLPTQENTHQVAHNIDPAIKIAYVDNDPQAVIHAKTILSDGGTKETVTVLDRDLRGTGELADSLSGFIDWSQPVALMLVAVMHFVEQGECYQVVDAYKDRMAPGSWLILSHSTADVLSEEAAALIEEEYARSNYGIYLRTKAQVTRFFGGTAILSPGITDVATWRSGPVMAQPTMVWGGAGKVAA
jgi:O-methyltransferase involved in polyketide biosynthesis